MALTISSVTRFPPSNFREMNSLLNYCIPVLYFGIDTGTVSEISNFYAELWFFSSCYITAQGFIQILKKWGNN